MEQRDPGSAERLKLRTDFVAAASGVKVPSASFLLQVRARQADGPPRVGFTVSRKVGNAVERNRVRRRLRELVRRSAASALNPGHDYVLVGRRTALAAPFDALVAELQVALDKLGRQSAGGRRGRAQHDSGRMTGPKASERA